MTIKEDDMDGLTVEHTQDEFGADRWFVTDEHGDWIGTEGPHDTRDLALVERDAIRRGEVER